MIKTYSMLTKPKIILGNLITMTAGVVLGAKGRPDLLLFLGVLVGLGCVIASACVCNNYIDRHADAVMERTRDRALAKGDVSIGGALFFALLLGCVGAAILVLTTNMLTLWLSLFGFFFYVVMYSIVKYRSSTGTLVGTIAGAMPPVIGYCAASHRFDLGAGILFLILILWQLPHFYAIAVYRLSEYAKAGIPVMPLVKGVRQTKVHMLWLIIGYLPATFLLPTFQYTRVETLLLATGIGLIWLRTGYQGFTTNNDQEWARKMFRVSLIVITVFSLAISIEGVAFATPSR
jgi:heme o synthase